MLKVGVIGAGSMGKNHVRIYSELENCQLLGFSDPEESRKELADKHNTRYFSTHEALLAEEPDLVSISAPTSLHYELATAALDAGCHLLVEKPVSDDLEKAQQLIIHAGEKQRIIAVGHIERFNPAVIALKQQIDHGELGEVLALHNTRVGPFHGRITDVGIILDLGVHDVDLITMLMGTRPGTVFASAMKRELNHEDHALLHLGFANGSAGTVELSWHAPYRMRTIQVSGTRHYALVDLIHQTILIYDEDADARQLLPRPVPVTKAEPLKLELENVIASVINGTEPACRAEDSVFALRACHAALDSAANREARNI